GEAENTTVQETTIQSLLNKIGPRMRTPKTQKPAQWRVLLCSCLLFASRYSFAKHTGIEAVCG
ncbi:hypothetical protein ACSKMS_004598, partial [Salmonella enterica]